MNIKLGSINCRNLIKQYNPSTTDNFIRSLESKKFNTLLYQETNARSHTYEKNVKDLQQGFGYHQAIWTEYCGISISIKL